MPNIVDITVRGNDGTEPVMDEIERRFKLGGQNAAEGFTRDANGRLHDNLGRFAAEGEELGDTLGRSAGKKGGDSFKSNISPLLMSAFVGAATLGPAALIAGAGVAAAGMAAILERSNAGIASEYHALGSDVSSTLTEAVAPFAGDVEKSMGILDQGLSTAGPELKNVFAAAAPYSEDIANSMVSLVNNALPGFAAGLREAAPLMQVLATVTGSIGKGIGEFVQELGTGSSGAATGLQALGSALEHILSDAGMIVGSLSQGLGPALRDILTVATPIADVLAHIVSAFPPHEIEAAAVATALLFAAFKIGTITGVVAEGTAFTAFLAEATTAEGAMTLASGTASAAMGALGVAMDAALGPIGAVALAVAAVSQATSDFGSDHSGGLGGVVRKEQEATKAAKDHSDALTAAAVAQDGFTTAIRAAAGAAGTSAEQSATATLAAVGLTDGTANLTTGLYNVLQAYSGATGAAQGYNQILNALNGTTASLDDAQNSMAQDLLTLKSSFQKNGESIDLNTQAGISNREMLSSAAKAAVQLATAQFQANGDMNAANQTLKQQENAILNATGATGKARDAIKAYLDQILKIPDNVTTNVHANVTPAILEAQQAVRTIGSYTAYIQVQASPGSAGGRQLLAAGGAVGAAHAMEGGPRGNVVTVGEHGIEDVSLPVGSTVFSHEDTMSRRGAGGSGGGYLTVEWVGSGNEALDALWTALRGHIRFRGGGGPDSVQKALGQG